MTGIWQMVYTWYIPVIWHTLSYDRYIPGIYQVYTVCCHMSGIYQVYTIIINFLRFPGDCDIWRYRTYNIPDKTSGILTTWYKRVHTCLRHVCTRYVQCLSTAAYIHAMYKYEKSWTCTYMYIHFWKCMYTYVHGMYMVCTKRAINVYVHCSDMYVHVYRFTYSFWII